MSNHSQLQQSIREITGTALDYNGDWSALFDLDGIPRWDWNGRLLAWLNAQMGTAYTSVPEAQNTWAALNGFMNWSAVNSIGWRAPPGYLLDGVAPFAVLSPASDLFVLNGRRVPVPALISRQGGVKYVIGKDGTLQQVAANVLAYDHASGHARLKFEGQATNLLTYAYSKTGLMITRTSFADGFIGPDARNNAIRLTMTGETDPNCYRSVSIAPSGLTITFSVWMRLNIAAGNAPRARLYMYGETGNEQIAFTDIILTSTWTRYSLTKVFPAGMTSTSLRARVDPFDGVDGTQTPTAGASIDIDCWQVETGAAATSYIPTSGAAVTRPADVAPLWSGAGQATAWAWRGNIPTVMAYQTYLGSSGGDYIRANTGNTATISFDGGGNILLSALNTIPGIQGMFYAWGTSGKRAVVPDDSIKETSFSVTYDRTLMSVGALSGLADGQVVDIDELVAWRLPDRPTPTGCRSQARVWSA